MQYLQTETAECGLVCLAYASSRLGAHLDIVDLRRKFPVASRGLTLTQLTEIAAGLDLMARAVRCELDELQQLKTPAILHWGFNHFVVLDKVTAHHVFLHDPARGKLRLSFTDASKAFTGIALELSAAPKFQKRREKGPLSIMAWVRLTPTLYSGLGQILLLSLILQVYAIASPFYMQIAIDQAALKGDSGLLVTLALGFGLFGLFNAGATVLRSLATQQISAHLSWDMGLRLFRHLVRVPLGWFQRRRLADTISRFDSINPIRDLVSGAFISSFIDGVLAVTTLLMMFMFAWPLAVCICLWAVLYVAMRLATMPTNLRLSAEALGAQIAENGKRIETIKAIQTIKVMSAEVAQETQWSNRYADYIRRNLSRGRFSIWITGANECVNALVTTLVIFLGARAIIDQRMTVGVFYAFLAYKGQFTGALTNIIEQVIQWRLTDVYSHRLADIVLTPKEDGIDKAEVDPPVLRGDVDIADLSFRYAPYEPFVFSNLNLQINAGEFIAISGPSGVGKSSLVKVICGLYPATSGEARVDGRSISAWGPRALRRNLGVVMQDDELLSGSIAENVAFFDEHLDLDRVWQALESAALADEVKAMPMKSETFVGDMGGALSGGQKQRLLIARALYRRPAILLMDEATSHLDARNEIAINRALKSLNITRIVIAHRIETLRAADRIFDMLTGRFVSLAGEDQLERI